MASKNNRKNNNDIKKLYIIGALLLVIIIVVNMILSNNKNNTTNDNQAMIHTEEQIEEENNEAIIQKLKNMEERDRMEYYFGMFLDYIEAGKYEKAYSMLYSEFKNNYFPTLDSFKKYVKTTFPEMSNIEHENIERNGDIYVLWIKITDVLNGKPGESKKMNIVIRENNYNDVEMSFSVI